MLEPVMYTGGLYKHDLVVELVEDLGGYVLQRNVTQTEIILLILVPTEDMALLQALAKELRGELVRAPLAGTEVAVVTPTLAIHHLPHSACDIAEYLRRHGSKTNMLGLARGVGREIAQINEYETALINEHDAAVFIFGNFQECIKKKESLYRNITVPVVVTGGPEIEAKDLPYAFEYVSAIGRVAHRARKATEIGTLDRIVESVGRALDKTRASIAKDPLTTSPPRVMDSRARAGAGCGVLLFAASHSPQSDWRAGEAALRCLQGCSKSCNLRRGSEAWARLPPSSRRG